MTVALVALGASLGRRRETLALAVAGLDRMAGCAVVGVSRAYRTSPEGAARCWFLNAVVRVRTQLGPFDLLRGIQELERRLGRRRTRRWADRCVDIDLLLFGEEVVDELGLGEEASWPAPSDAGYKYRVNIATWTTQSHCTASIFPCTASISISTPARWSNSRRLFKSSDLSASASAIE